jgi:hypothetical protein
MRNKMMGGDANRDDNSLPTPEEMVEARKHTGGTALSSVIDQIKSARSFLSQNTPPDEVDSGKKGRKKKI